MSSTSGSPADGTSPCTLSSCMNADFKDSSSGMIVPNAHYRIRNALYSPGVSLLVQYDIYLNALVCGLKNPIYSNQRKSIDYGTTEWNDFFGNNPTDINALMVGFLSAKISADNTAAS